MLFENGDTIVFAGDSVTDAGRLRPVGEGLWDGVGSGYVRLIDSYLAVEFPELTLRCINMGVSGDTSADLLERWNNDVTSLNPDWVVLCIGFNDVWRQFDSPAQADQAVLPEQFRANLNAMANKTKSRMIWLTPYFIESNKTDAMRRRMDEYGAIMKEEAAKRNILCIDLQQAFDKFLVHRHSSYISWDRVHPGWIGNMLIAREFIKICVSKI